MLSIPRKSILTKLCPLVGSGILYMDHPKDHSLFGLGLPGYWNILIFICAANVFNIKEFLSHTFSAKWNLIPTVCGLKISHP